MNKPFKVLHIFSSLGMGGAETWMLEMLKFWQKNPVVQSDFILTSGRKSVFDDEFLELGSKLFYIEFSRKNILSYAQSFRNILKHSNYDVLHAHLDYMSGWHFKLAGKLAPEKCITHIHNPFYQSEKSSSSSVSRHILSSLGKKFISNRANYILGTSQYVIDRYGFNDHMFDKSLKKALYCAFDAKKFRFSENARATIFEQYSIPNNAKLILVAGRIDPSTSPTDQQRHKNTALTIAILFELMKTDKTIHAVFCGKKSDAVDEYIEKIKLLNLEKRIQFLGIQPNIEIFMSAADLLLFPSREEGLGMVAVEAQAAGLKVIASNGVPKECVVIESLVDFVDENQPIGDWVFEIIKSLNEKPINRVEANFELDRSRFSVENCSKSLCEIYGGRPS